MCAADSISMNIFQKRAQDDDIDGVDGLDGVEIMKYEVVK